MGIRVGEAEETTLARGRERWLVPPRLLTSHETGERHASWLELFFDVVFVVAITELSHQLVVDHSTAGFLRFYGVGYGVGAAIWLASLAVDTPARYVVWGIALTLELSLPPLSTRLHRRVPTSARHLPERWALFTLIVLGESVVAVAAGVSG